jgi:hypothetical protein
MNKLVRVLVVVIIFLLISIGILVWLFIFKDKPSNINDVSDVEVKDALYYFNNYSDIFAAKALIDYCDKDSTILNNKECDDAFKKYNLYNENKVALELLSEFIKGSNIKSKDEMSTILDLWNQISINGDELIYLYSKTSREKVIKGYKLIDVMNKTKSQNDLVEFKNYYKSNSLNNLEKYSIYLYMIKMPNLLSNTKIIYNNKEITFDHFLESENIYYEAFDVINSFYKKFNVEK